MKKLLLTSATFAALIAGPATAADQAARVHKRPRPVVVAAPVYSWTGFYVGGNVGGSWGNARTDVAGSGTSISLPTVAPFTNPPTTFADSPTQRLNGVIGGGQLGYNYQFSPRWVLGFEADIQGSGERGSNTFIDPLSGTICTNVHHGRPDNTCGIGGSALVNGAAVTSSEAKIEWFGTVRGRLGFLISDQVLFYGTGGLAYGRVELSGISTVNGLLAGGILSGSVPLTPGASSFSQSRTNVGFAVGGGIEGKFSYWLPAGWTWKLEYLYVDLGSLDSVSTFPGAFVPAQLAPPGVFISTSPFTGPLTTHTRFTDNIIRVGLNYKFGNYYAPVVTK
jgi:outer membrane immunogenic protein